MKKGVIVIILCTLLIGACNWIFTTKIGDILKNPREYAEKDVTISGEVTETFAFLFVKYFTVKDETGEIAVVTNKPLPNKGEHIRVNGIVKEAFSIGDKSLIVLVENSGKSEQ